MLQLPRCIYAINMTQNDKSKKKQNVVGVSTHAKIKNIESNKNRLV